MNEVTNLKPESKNYIAVAIAVLMFIFFAFCPVCDIMGKAQINGFQLVFKADGLGFSRFLGFLLLIIPILIVVFGCVGSKGNNGLGDKLPAICFGASFIIGIIMAACLPKGVALAWGAYINILAAIAGAVVCGMAIYAKK